MAAVSARERGRGDGIRAGADLADDFGQAVAHVPQGEQQAGAVLGLQFDGDRQVAGGDPVQDGRGVGGLAAQLAQQRPGDEEISQGGQQAEQYDAAAEQGAGAGQAVGAVVQHGFQLRQGDLVQLVLGVDGLRVAGEEIGGREPQGLRLDDFLLGQFDGLAGFLERRPARLGQAGAEFGVLPDGAFQRVIQADVVFLGAVDQHHDPQPFGVGRFMARQQARALGACLAEQLGQHGHLVQRHVDQVVALRLRVEAQPVVLQQQGFHPQQAGDQLDVGLEAVGGCEAFPGHLGFERSPALADFLPGGQQRRGQDILAQRGVQRLEGLIGFALQGGAPGFGGRVAVERDHRQAAVLLCQLQGFHQQAHRPQAARFLPGRLDGLAGFVHVQDEGRGDQHHAEERQHGEFLPEAEPVQGGVEGALFHVGVPVGTALREGAPTMAQLLSNCKVGPVEKHCADPDNPGD